MIIAKKNGKVVYEYDGYWWVVDDVCCDTYYIYDFEEVEMILR